MNVLFTNHVAKTGGAELSLLDMADALKGTRYAPHVALPQGDAADRLRDAGVPVHTLPFTRLRRSPRVRSALAFTASLAVVVPRLLRLVKRQNITLLHANSTTAQIYAGLVGRLCGLPSIWHCRDLVPLRRLGPSVGRLSARAIAVSNAVAESIRPFVPDSRLRVISHGVDVDRFKPAPRSSRLRRELGIEDSSCAVVMVGQVIPWKGHRLFIEAAGRVAADVPHAKFIIVGTDLFNDHTEYVAHLRRYADQSGLGDRLVFTGFRDDIPGLLASIDIYAHAAENEPLGRAVLEAMATQKPVVAVASGGPAEIIRHETDGLLVPPRDAGALAAALVRLARDPEEATALGVAARQRVIDAYNLADYGPRIVTLYDELLREREP